MLICYSTPAIIDVTIYSRISKIFIASASVGRTTSTRMRRKRRTFTIYKKVKDNQIGNTDGNNKLNKRLDIIIYKINFVYLLHILKSPNKSVDQFHFQMRLLLCVRSILYYPDPKLLHNLSRQLRFYIISNIALVCSKYSHPGH